MTWTKFVIPDEVFTPVLKDDLWKRVKEDNNYYIITTEPRKKSKFEQKLVSSANNEINKFIKKAKINIEFAKHV